MGAIVIAPLFGFIIDRQCSQDDHVKPSKDTEKQHKKFMMDIEDTPKVMDFIIQCSRKKIFKLNDAVLVTVSSTVVFCLLSLVPSLTVQVISFFFFFGTNYGTMVLNYGTIVWYYNI